MGLRSGTGSGPRGSWYRAVPFLLVIVLLAPPSLARHQDAGEELLRFIGPPLRPAFAELLGDDDAGLVERAVEAYRERYGREGVYEASVYPGLPEVLRELERRGARLHVATSKPEVYAERVLEHLGLRSHFASVSGALLSGERSEKAQLVAHALDSHGVDAASAWMVGTMREMVPRPAVERRAMMARPPLAAAAKA